MNFHIANVLDGDNKCTDYKNYQIVCMNNDRLCREGRLSVSIICDRNVLLTALDVANSDFV